ncbi:MAG: hypothetical protein A3J75_06520 [Acidobacteria bacterium RBG_16_68_9]|nr:MAG: hypothetical protein A3J75_06520 [Acidobacteria bacterium RBG_16_68_9]
MALNTRRLEGRHVNTDVPAGYTSGDPVIVGEALPGVLCTDRSAAGTATIDTAGTYEHDVEAAAGAIAPGDIVYLAEYLGAPVLSNTNTGDRFGYALGVVGNGLTVATEVKTGY